MRNAKFERVVQGQGQSTSNVHPLFSNTSTRNSLGKMLFHISVFSILVAIGCCKYTSKHD